MNPFLSRAISTRITLRRGVQVHKGRRPVYMAMLLVAAWTFTVKTIRGKVNEMDISCCRKDGLFLEYVSFTLEKNSPIRRRPFYLPTNPQILLAQKRCLSFWHLISSTKYNLLPDLIRIACFSHCLSSVFVTYEWGFVTPRLARVIFQSSSS